MKLADKWSLIYRAWRYRMRVEPHEVRFMLRRLSPGQTVVDIGAHKGAFTYWMQRAVGPRGQVYSFEPQPELAAYLQFMKSAFRFKQLTVVNAGLSSQPGGLPLYRPAQRPSPGASFEPGLHQAPQATMVRVHTLDEFFAAHPDRRPVHFIKCDVEGHELQVFQGARGILSQDRPLLLFECEGRHHQNRSIESVFQYLESLGYRGSFLKHGRRFALDQFDERRDQQPTARPYIYNFIFETQ